MVRVYVCIFFQENSFSFQEMRVSANVRPIILRFSGILIIFMSLNDCMNSYMFIYLSTLTFFTVNAELNLFDNLSTPSLLLFFIIIIINIILHLNERTRTTISARVSNIFTVETNTNFDLRKPGAFVITCIYIHTHTQKKDAGEDY